MKKLRRSKMDNRNLLRMARLGVRRVRMILRIDMKGIRNVNPCRSLGLAFSGLSD